MITVVHGINRRHAEGTKTCSQSAYACAVRKPNYPMPATQDNAEIAGNWLALHLCPLPNGPCPVCIDEFIDALGYMD